MAKKPTVPAPKIVRTLKAINTALDSFEDGQNVTVKFKPLTNKCWEDEDSINGAKYISDQYADPIDTTLLYAIVHGEPVDFVAQDIDMSCDSDAATVRLCYGLNGDSGSIYVSAKYIAEMTIGAPPPPKPLTCYIDGMTYNMTVRDDVIEFSTGHRVTRGAALSAMKTIAERLGCNVTLSSKSVALGSPSQPPPAPTARVARTETEILAIFNSIPGNSDLRSSPGEHNRITVRFKPITDACWLRNGATRPADGEFNGAHLTSIVANQTMSFARLSRAYGCWRFDDGNGPQYVHANQIVALTVPPAPASTSAALRFEDVRETCTWANDSGLKIGCQNITGNGVMELLLILAKFSGYTVNNPVGIAAANKISKFNLVDATAKLRLDPTDTTPTPAAKK